ncbi:putative UPF0481 protein At3g02645 [Cryptomeria japonica]|uniref:putative UPF0481 protein At3g02645 n=1 Tax=Cryptomeria japonica TaxID=3369 RepID=UPI0027DA4C58|nr:putative UPF0481 protein At3g02645 [Cryptomeria japonica]
MSNTENETSDRAVEVEITPCDIRRTESMNNKENEKFDEGSWVAEVKSNLQGEMRPDIFGIGLIQTVPKSLLSKKTKVFYLPEVISFGPYHFRKNYVRGDDTEPLKSDVARKMHLGIIRDGGLTKARGLELVVEDFESEEIQKIIKKSYAEEIELCSVVFAWMIVRDACFLLEVLHRFGKDEDQEEIVPVFIDTVLSRKRHHPLLTEIVKDMLKMENQLPLWALEKIRLCIKGSNAEVWFESALKHLSPIRVAEGRKREYHMKESHILQLLHDYIVDRQDDASSENQSAGCGIKDFNLNKIMPSSIRIKWLFALLFFPVFVILFILGIIFVILHFIKNHIFDILYSIMNCLSSREDETEEVHVPSIGELRRGGMKFKKLEGGISQIKFNKKNSTLYLPQFKVDERSEVILKNLIALEICSREEQKPITRYAILMNDLVDTNQDVGLLRCEDIIIGKLGNDTEIANLWNSMVSPTEMPREDI